MNSSSQKVGVSNSSNQSFDLLNPQQEEQEQHQLRHNRSSGINGEGNEELKEEILPSYDFQSIQPILPPRGPSLADSSANSSNFRITQEMDHNSINPSMVSDIDRTLKKYTDNLLHQLEGISARLSKLEIKTSDIDTSVDELKISVGNNSSKNKLRSLENILKEVQSGVQILRDKQELMEALQLAKSQASRGDKQSEDRKKASPPQQLPGPPQGIQLSTVVPESQVPTPPQQYQYPSQLQAPPPQQSQYFQQPNIAPGENTSQLQAPPHQQTPQYFQQPQVGPVNSSQPHPPFHGPEENPSQLQAMPPQVPHQQHPQYYQQPPVALINSSHPHPPLGHGPEENPNQLQVPHQHPSQYFQPQPPLGHRPEENPSQLQAPHQQSQYYQPQPQPPLGHRPEENPYIAPQRYTPPSQPYYNPPHSSGYDLPSSDSYSSSGTYSRLPVAQILPRAVPTASSSEGELGTSGGGKKVPIDDVVDKVVTMGFSRDQVNATVRKLTENGKSVDLNVVLDKLMNGDGGVEPKKGWFGR